MKFSRRSFLGALLATPIVARTLMAETRMPEIVDDELLSLPLPGVYFDEVSYRDLSQKDNFLQPLRDCGDKVYFVRNPRSATHSYVGSRPFGV